MKKTSRLLIIFSLLAGFIGAMFWPAFKASAAFNASDLMDNSIFDNVNAMSTVQINSFLNSFSGSCISPNNNFLAPDPIGYSPTTGFMYGADVTAGQVINDAAQAYGINPEVLLTTLQKEQSLVSGGGGCSVLNYAAAMGYGCPDGGTTYNYSGVDLYTLNGTEITSVSQTCVSSSLQVGFSQQVIHAAWLLKFGEQRSEGNVTWAVNNGNWNNSDDPPTCYYGPMTAGSRAMSDSINPCSYSANGTPIPGNQPLIYSGYTTIDSTSVQVETGATAALYWYTPHFAGNQNFDNIFQSWFGPTTTGDFYFEVINTNPDTGANMWYLLTPEGKYYIPSMSVYDAWGLNNYAFQTVSQTYFDSLPAGPNLGNLLKDQYNNYFFMDNGETHYIPNASFLTLWNLNPGTAAQSTGLVYSLPQGNWVGRFLTDPSSSPSQIYLMDGGAKRLVSNTNLLYEWGYTPSQLTAVSSSYLSSVTTGSDVTQYVSSGTQDFVVDTDRLISFPNSDTQNAYGAHTYTTMNQNTLSFLSSYVATTFVQASGSQSLYMLDNNSLRYVPTIQLAEDWGYVPVQGPTFISSSLFSSFSASSNLTYLAQRSSDNSIWVVDGQKHLIPSGSTENAWVSSGSTVPIYSSQSLDLLVTGLNATDLIQANGSPNVYTLDNGQMRYLPSLNALNAWGSATISISVFSQNLISSIPEGSTVSYMVQNSGNYYLLMNGFAYAVNPTYYNSWNANSSTPLIANSTLARFQISSQSIGPYVQIGGINYIMENLYAIPVVSHLDAYNFTSSNTVNLPNNYFTTLPDASFLIQSTSTSDSRLWLVSNGQKYWLNSFPLAVSYGWISQRVPITYLDPAVLNQIPTNASIPSLLITTPGSGVKLINFGRALAFPNQTTLTDYERAPNYIFSVSPSIYNQFALYASTSSLIEDDYGNVYSVNNGQKNWITNPSLLSTTYSGIPITYLDGTTMALIPTGSQIN